MSNDHAELERFKTEINLAHTHAAEGATAMTDPKRPAVIEQHPADWQAGYDAGLAGQQIQPPSGVDPLAWYSGLTEGKGDQNKPPEERKPAAHQRPPPRLAIKPRRKPKEQG